MLRSEEQSYSTFIRNVLTKRRKMPDGYLSFKQNPLIWIIFVQKLRTLEHPHSVAQVYSGPSNVLKRLDVTIFQQQALLITGMQRKLSLSSSLMLTRLRSRVDCCLYDVIKTSLLHAYIVIGQSQIGLIWIVVAVTESSLTFRTRLWN